MKTKWKDLSLTSKLILEVGFIAGLLLFMNMAFYTQINRSIKKLDNVYASNVDMTLLSSSLNAVQDNMYQYLKVKSSESLMDYYESEGTCRELLGKLSNEKTNNSVKLLERNIRQMSETYLENTAETVAAKRGRNVKKYKTKYEETSELYGYIQSAMDELNNQLFQNNTQSYDSLRQVLKYLEISNMAIMFAIVICGFFLVLYVTGDMVSPLKNMAETAALVGQGNFNVKMHASDARDELGAVTRAFNTMVENLDIYMAKTKESMEKEQQMMERELLMENHLKEAQLKYLQSQINPHFLFNSLNAGAQLAMMEDAEKTGIFVQKMADFFRYNVKKGEEDATLEEELDAVDNYIYILNVRFAGDIHFEKEVDETVENIRIPSMILQPVVENAVNHGIRDIEWEGKINLSVHRQEENVEICIRDNGKGMTEAQIKSVLEGSSMQEEDRGDSTGIGMNNVISRLELYYEKKNLVEIYSDGPGKGTEVILNLPAERRQNV